MKYIRTKLATDWPKEICWRERLVKIILFFIPKANPTYDSVMHLITEWFVEIDDENLPWREIGFDENGNPIVAGPSKRNYGFWLDTDMSCEDFSDAVDIRKDLFENKWIEYWQSCENDYLISK